MKLICLFISSIIFYCSYSFAQTKEVRNWNKRVLTNAIQVSTDDDYSTINILKKGTIKHIRASLIYYWYYSNGIHHSQGNYSGKLLHGKFTSYYHITNNLKEKGQFKKGLKYGTWILWYDNGLIADIVGWRKGMKKGLYKKYDLSGNLMETARYRRDMICGKQIIYDNGLIVSKKRYKHGKEVLPKTDKKKDRKPKERKEKKNRNVLKRMFKSKRNKDNNNIDNKKEIITD